MSGRKSAGWIIVNAGRGGRFECLRCGRWHQPNLPIEAWAFSALATGFAREHAKCALKPEGLHCIHCGQTGHDPKVCKTLNAKTPEQWLAGTDTGMSSRTIYGALYHPSGYSRLGADVRATVPLDPSDFGRCHRLLKLFPAWRPRLGEVASKHPDWKPLVEHWAELEALYEEERPTGKCPKLYARMQELNRRELGMTPAQKRAYQDLLDGYEQGAHGVPCDSVEGMVLAELEPLGLVKRVDWGGIFPPRWFPTEKRPC